MWWYIYKPSATLLPKISALTTNPVSCFGPNLCSLNGQKQFKLFKWSSFVFHKKKKSHTGFHNWMSFSFHQIGSSFIFLMTLNLWESNLNLQFQIKRVFLHRNDCMKGTFVHVSLKTRDAELNKQIRTTAGSYCRAFEVYWIPGSPLMCRLWTQFQSVLHKWLFGERYFG